MENEFVFCMLLAYYFMFLAFVYAFNLFFGNLQKNIKLCIVFFTLSVIFLILCIFFI